MKQKLKSFSLDSSCWMKKETSNWKLVDIWDNFEYCENVNDKDLENEIKFWSIIIAL